MYWVGATSVIDLYIFLHCSRRLLSIDLAYDNEFLLTLSFGNLEVPRFWIEVSIIQSFIKISLVLVFNPIVVGLIFYHSL